MSFLKNLFKERGIKDVITLFHNAKSPASVNVYNTLQKATAAAGSQAVHPQTAQIDSREFELEVQESAPTGDQLRSILEYLGPNEAGTVVEGAEGTADALRKFSAQEQTLQRPITVDWNRGKAVVGDKESEILALLKALPSKS